MRTRNHVGALLAPAALLALASLSSCGGNNTYNPDLVGAVARSFNLTVAPASVTVTAGQSATYTATLTAVNGFSSPVDLTVSGLPADTSGAFSPTPATPTAGGATSTLTVTTSAGTGNVGGVIRSLSPISPTGPVAPHGFAVASRAIAPARSAIQAPPAPTPLTRSRQVTAPGTYTLTITATGGGVTKTATVTLVVQAVNAPSFTITAGTSQTVAPGASASYNFTIASVNGFAGTVTFSMTGLPTGATATFTPTSVNLTANGTANASLSIATTGSTPAGTTTPTIVGTSGTLTNQATETLIVSGTGPTFTITGCGSTTLNNGLSAGQFFDCDFSVTATNGFAGTVTFSATNLPSGFTASFQPASVNVAPGTNGSGTYRLTTSATLAPGTYAYTIVGTSGSTVVQINESLVVPGPAPTGIRVFDVGIGPTDGKIYFADEGGGIGRIDDMTGANLVRFGNPGSANQITSPRKIAFDAQGRIYVADFFRIVRFDDMNGTNFTALGTAPPGPGVKQFDGASGIAVDKNGRIYVADTNNHRIVRVDDMSGTNWTTFGTSGSGTGQFNFPDRVFVDSALRIYVVDAGLQRLDRMDDMAGTNFTTFGSQGSGVDQFVSPVDVIVDGAGHIFVVDADGGTGTDRIDRFDDMTGANWTMFGSEGTGVGQFTGPNGIALDAQGRIYVADRMGRNGSLGRIDRFDNMSGANFVSFAPPAP